MLCHVTTEDTLAGEWLEATPFLHCCTEAQLAFVLERWFAGRTGLLVARFDAADVVGRVEWVRSEEGMEAFPHVFGRVTVQRVQRSVV